MKMMVDDLSGRSGIVHVNPHFMIIPSNACNASCRYCFGPNKGSVITSGQFKKSIDFIDRVVHYTGQQKVHITFHGGEPLMAPLDIWREGLKHIGHTLSDRRLKLQIQSNLWNLTSDHCTLFKDFDVSFSTSLDGPEEINDRHRGKGYFYRAMKSIDLLRDNNIKVGCIATFTPFNAESYAEVFRFFASQRLSFGVHASLPSLQGGTSPYVLDPEDYAKLMCNLFDLYVPNRKYVSVSGLDQLCRSVVNNCGMVCTFRDCSGSFLATDPEGNVYPCQRFAGDSRFCLGNISEKGLELRLSSAGVIKDIVSYHKKTDSLCSDCVHQSYCRGGCYYNSRAAGSDRDPYCTAYKAIFDRIRSRLLREMTSPENFSAIVDKPYDGHGHPLMRRGEVTELTQTPHPVAKASNALKIVSMVELSRHKSVDEAMAVLQTLGLNVERDSLSNLQSQLSAGSFRLNNCYVHATFRCQLSCTHCYAAAGAGRKESMTAGQIVSLLQQSGQAQFRQAVLTGGEPLLLPDLDSLLRTLISLRSSLEPLILVLRTNFAMPLTDSVMEMIAGAFHQVVVSVDGDRQSHDNRRGTGSYDMTTSNVIRYQQIVRTVNKPAELSVACVMTADAINGPEGHAVRAFAGEQGIRRVRFKPVLPIGNAAGTFPEIVSEALDSYADPAEALCHTIRPMKTCGFGHNLYIEPSGDIFPCYAFHKPHTHIGNVFGQDLHSVVTSAAFTSLSHHTVDTNAKCSRCEYRYLCGGACRAWGRELTQQSPDAPPPECRGLFNKAESIYNEALRYLLH